MKTVKFYTLGCKVNQYETQLMRERLGLAGIKEVDQKAGICIINTCTVTRKADKDSFYYINRAFKENPGAEVLVTGCLAALDEKKIKAFRKNISILKDKNQILDKLKLKNKNNPKGISDFKDHARAFLKIQDGCNNFCSYCKVPLVRGRSISKPLCGVMKEAKALVAGGFKEIVLTGICLGAYGKDFKNRLDLSDLLLRLEEIEGLKRIRLSSIEAADITDKLINTFKKMKKLCAHLHIPIQSGDDIILHKMNRRYSSLFYRRLIQKLKGAIPNIAITTDVLVGFPGEKEENFRNTCDLVKEILPLKVHIFPYSLRSGTIAAKMKEALISKQAINLRISLLREISNLCADAYRKAFLFKKKLVLFERKVKNTRDLWEGYTDNYIRVKAKSSENLKNKLFLVKLKKIEDQEYVLADLVD